MCCVMGYTGHDLSAAKFKEYLLRTVMRGPDDQRVVEGPFGLMGFGRLAIMGLTPEGMQPFHLGRDMAVCNGELLGVVPASCPGDRNASASAPIKSSSIVSPACVILRSLPSTRSQASCPADR